MLLLSSLRLIVRETNRERRCDDSPAHGNRDHHDHYSIVSLGKREYVTNFLSFIMIIYIYVVLLLSGEDLEGGILKSYILEADEALVLSAVDHFDDSSIKSM